MANPLTPEEKKLVSMLYSARHLDKLVELLQRRLDAVSKQLRVAGPDMFQRVQGRAIELEELIEALTSASKSA